MSYPQIIEYNEVVQSPLTAFRDSVLRQGRIATTPLGLPKVLSGGFALTYQVENAGRRFAVRCFHREVPNVARRYAAISAVLKRVRHPAFVDFEFQAQGVNIRGNTYPLVRMEWIDGDTLNVYLDRHYRDSNVVARLRDSFQQLAKSLTAVGVAHGDIQNGNVLVTPSGLRLVDYDGMFVSGMTAADASELGHKHFQHPKRSTADFGLKVDRFSFIAIDLSLAAILQKPELYPRFKEGGETIIFRANDYENPYQSEAFDEVSAIPALTTTISRFRQICDSAFNAVPILDSFLRDGTNIPPLSPIGTSKASTKYIGPYDVVAASNFASVISSVGNRIELIGKIVHVRIGASKRGRAKGKPYALLDFGDSSGDCVRLAIWADGLKQFQVRPDTYWKDKWVSVRGLVDPPYLGQRNGQRFRHVGITIETADQIQTLSKSEAQFRLGKTQVLTRNRKIVLDITGPPPPATAPSNKQSTITPLNNRAKLTAHIGARPTTENPIQSATAGPSSTNWATGTTAATASQPMPTKSNGIRPLLAIVSVIVILVLLAIAFGKNSGRAELPSTLPSQSLATQIPTTKVNGAQVGLFELDGTSRPRLKEARLHIWPTTRSFGMVVDFYGATAGRTLLTFELRSKANTTVKACSSKTANGASGSAWCIWSELSLDPGIYDLRVLADNRVAYSAQITITQYITSSVETAFLGKFRGNIEAKPYIGVEMDMLRKSGDQIAGTYFYLTQRKPVRLTGTITSNRWVVASGYFQDVQIDAFSGHLTTDRYSGTYTRKSDGKTMPFSFDRAQ